MPKTTTRSVLAAGLLSTIALGGLGSPGAVAEDEPTAAEVAAATPRVVDLPLDVLEASLPTDAFEAGLDYAPQLVKVYTGVDVTTEDVVATGLDVTEHAGHDYVEVVLYSQDEQDVLDALGVRYTVVTADLIAQERERILADASFAQATAATELPSGRTSYRVLADFEAEIDQLVADNPTIAKKVVVGQSVESRDLVGIEIGVGVTEPEDGRPVFLMFGNHHAREWPSAETPMEFAHDLIATYNAGDARTVDLLSRARAIIVPVSNPDGFDASRTSGDLLDLNEVDGGGTVSILATPGNAYKRKNCRIIDGQTQPAGACVAFSSPGGQGIGVDLNRNYGALWGGPGADAEFQSAIYRGPAPFSEPETQAIRDLISTRQVTTLISNHTFSNLLLRPVGIQPATTHPDGFPIGFAPDECFTTSDGTDLGMQALGERMTAQTAYSNQFGWELYDTTGTTEDYSYNATGGYGYTFEIGPNQFHPPYEEVTAEYLGTTEGAQALTPETAPFTTSVNGQDCPGDPVDHDTVGGGLREAYFIALENAANTETHAQITGEAPTGAEITVTRSGEFPLWSEPGADRQSVPDTVTTTMLVPGDTAGEQTDFTYHVNPSTRPFAAARAYEVCPDDPAIPLDECDLPPPNITEAEELTYAGGIGESTPQEPARVPFEVPAGIDAISVTMTAPNPADDYDMTVFTPTAVPVGSSANGGTDEFVEFYRAAGIQPGEWVVQVENFAAAGPFDIVVSLGTIDGEVERLPLEFTPTTAESWTVTCTFDGEELGSTQVDVDRGESVDVGTLCAAGDVTEAPDPDGELAATGGGAALLAVLALGAGTAVATRRRRED